MSQTKSQGSIRRAPLVAFLLLAILAVITWWINTVLAMMFVFSALFAFVYGLCTLPLQEVQVQTRAMKRRRMHIEWDRIPVERLDLLEEQMRESLKQFEVQAEDEGFSIPVDEMETEAAGLVHDIPVEVVDGIGRTFGRKLREADVSSLDDLADADAAKIAKICSVEAKEARAWVADAKAIVQGAGVTSILELAMSDPGELLQKVEQAVEDGFIEVPRGHEFTIWAARHWIAAANEHIVLTPEDIRRWSEDQP